MMSLLGLYNHGHSALVLHNCNKLVVYDPFLVPFLPTGCISKREPSIQIHERLVLDFRGVDEVEVEWELEQR